MPRSKTANQPASDLIPIRPSLSSLREAAADCRACDLWKRGTQTVFGEGRRRAKVMFIGEQPIHKRPNAIEISACRPWLQAEIALIKPDVIVILGATAAQSLLGPKIRVTKQRGEFLESNLAPYLMATLHPSSILRAPDAETRRLELRRFIDDLKKLARVIKITPKSLAYPLDRCLRIR